MRELQEQKLPIFAHATHLALVGALLAALAPSLLGLAACGNGRWGAQLSLDLETTDASEVPLAQGADLSLGGGYRLVLSRACLNVETLVVAPVASETGSSGDETCFCHGDPPHCHGDCGASAAGEIPPIIKSVHRGADLLSGRASLLSSGAAPGEYDRVTLSLSEARDDAQGLPPACADLQGRAFWLEGVLFAPGAAQGAPLVIDLRVTDKITEPIAATLPGEATRDGGRLLLGLRLDLALQRVDWSRVLPGGDGNIIIGGAVSSNIIALGEMVAGLTSASSWALVPGAE
ncbi:MAG: hypothetical protein RBU30_00030 [Polyangia bacterium]|jgi:hypothetical protein|nr:hypothetical protein [Polyangia bacterium]